MRPSPLIAVAIPTFAAALAAQTPPELVGLLNATPAPVVTQDFGSCATQRCISLLTAPNLRESGGVAYDATMGGVWISNGLALMAVDTTTCRPLCPPQALPLLSVNSQITGLAVNEAAGVMLVSDQFNVLYEFKLGCPIQSQVSFCRAGAVLPLTHTIGGLATDDVNDLVFYSASDFNGLNPNNFIVVARRAAPCTPLCRIPVNSCGGVALGPITGLGFEPCRQVLWATDGNQTVGLQWPGVALCQVQEVQCCSLGTVNGYVGLCVKPSQATSSGTSCTNLGCPNCPNLAHVTTGDAALGNPLFSLDLINAPAQSRTALFLNAGACTAPGFSLPPFCGALLVPISNTLITVPMGTGGTVGCDGGASVLLPIPLDRSLCGGTLSSQYVGVCANAIIGTFVSNCLTWTITGT